MYPTSSSGLSVADEHLDGSDAGDVESVMKALALNGIAFKGQPLLVLNAQWSLRADFGVSEFGFGQRRRRAEEFVQSFAPAFELYEGEGEEDGRRRSQRGSALSGRGEHRSPRRSVA